MDGPEHWASSSLLDRILRWYLDKIEKDPGRDTLALQEIKEPFRMKELESLVATRTEEFGSAVLSLLEQLRTERSAREKQSQDLAGAVASKTSIEKEGEKLKRKLKRAENRSVKYTRKLEVSNARARELEETIQKISLGLQESKNTSTMFETELSELRQTVSALRTQLDEKLREVNRIKDVNTNQYLRITKLESSLSETMAKLGSGEMAIREVASLKNLLSHRIELNRELEVQHAKQNEKISGLESQIASLLHRVETAEQKNRGLLEENTRLKESLSGMAGFQGVGQFVELKKEVARLNDTLKVKQEKLSVLELSHSQLEQEKASLVNEKASMLTELSTAEQTMKDIKSALESTEQYQGIDSLISYKEITDGKAGNQHKMLVTLRETLFAYSKKICQAEQLERRVTEVNLQLEAKMAHISELENGMRTLKQREENERQRRETLIKELEQSNEARIRKDTEVASLSFMLSEKDKQIGQLLKDEQKQAALLARLEEEKRYLTEEMTRKVEAKLAQLGEAEKLSAHQLQLKVSEIADLEKKISEAQLSVSKTIKDRDAIDQQCKELREVLNKQLVKEDLLVKEVDRLEAANKALALEHQTLVGEGKGKDQKISEAKNQLDTLGGKMKELEIGLKEKAKVEAFSKELQDSLQTQKRAFEGQQNELKRLLATNTNLEARYKISASELLSKDMKLSELHSQITKLRDAFDQLKNKAVSEIDGKNKEVGDLKALVLETRNAHKKQALVIEILEREKGQFEDQCNQLRVALEKERSARDDQAKDPVLTRKLAAKEQKLSEVSSELGRLENKYQDLEADHFQITQQLERKSKEVTDLQSQLACHESEQLQKERTELEKKYDELKEVFEHERSSREFQTNEIDTLNNTNSNLESKCQELSAEVVAKDAKLDELLAQLVEVKEQAAAMEEMKNKVVSMLRFASGGKMQELLRGSEEKSDETDTRMLLSQFSSASLRHHPKIISAEPIEHRPETSLESIRDDDTKIRERDTDTSSVSSGDDDLSSQRVFELESWAEALEEDNRSMELALISLETDMIELESHRDYLEDVIHRALNQLSKPTPGEKAERTPESTQLVEQTRVNPTDLPRSDTPKMISFTINKWLGDATYR